MSDKFGDVLERERKREESPHAIDGEAALPRLDDPYKAVANMSTRSEEVLCCILGREEYQTGGEVYRFFQYVHMASNTGLSFAKDGLQVMRLRFIGPEPVTLSVHGRDLLKTCHLIHRHRIGWIRLFDRERDFPFLEAEAGKRTQIITRIDIIDERKQKKADERKPGDG